VSSLEIPIIAVPTLEAIAHNFCNNEGVVAVVVNACKDDYNVALFAARQGNINRLTKDMTVSMKNVAEVLSKVEGEISVASDRDIAVHIKNKNIFHASAEASVPWARHVALIGGRKLKVGERSDLIGLKSDYSHNPNIREYKK
jgi:tRNA A37 threonylcarbamoyladenosine modification protein TsaB